MIRIHGGIDAQFAMMNLNTNRKNVDIAEKLLIGQRTVNRVADCCPYYQGVCGLDERYICFCESNYKNCNIYKKHLMKPIDEQKDGEQDAL